MLTIKTTKLQELISKATKGVGNKKDRPITESIAIKVENNILTLVTTDYDNYLYISAEVESDDFYAVVNADLFAKLITRITTDSISLDVSDSSLVIKGNGEHQIPLTIDITTGDIVEYPDPVSEIAEEDKSKIGELGVADIKTIIRAVKPALALTVEMPQYIHYYFGDVVLATDTNKVGCYRKKITDMPILVSAEVMELLDVYTSDQPIVIYSIGNRLLFTGENCTIYGYSMDGIDAFNVTAINSYVNKEYPSSCKLPKQEVLQLIDRLSLFVDVFDEDVVNISFTEDGMEMSSQKSNSVESIPYTESKDLQEVTGRIYLDMLRSQIKAQTGDNIEVYFGDGKSLKLVDQASDTTSIVCMVG